MVAESINPPLAHHYNKILSQYSGSPICPQHDKSTSIGELHEELLELPLIDLGGLRSENEEERAQCMAEIIRASSEWGFFQVVNHGICLKMLNKMRKEQIKLFNATFNTKSTLLNKSYRWGSTNALSPGNFSWSEAFHIPLNTTDIYTWANQAPDSLRQMLVEYSAAMHKLGQQMAEILVMNVIASEKNVKQVLEQEMMISESSTCFLRLNRYPPCPLLLLNENVNGLVAHTDSDFLTILHQDQVGGLQLIKDSKWVAVKPIEDALIINIGDLFQAWSNDLYKSVEHKVVPNPEVERFSVAYFVCPSYDSLIGRSCTQDEPSVYKSFTFGEYRNKVQQDAKLLGRKVGLARFRRE